MYVLLYYSITVLCFASLSHIVVLYTVLKGMLDDQ